MIDAKEAKLVRIIFPHRGEIVTAVVRHTGAPLQRYLSVPPVGEFHLLGRAKRLRIFNQTGKKVKLRYAPDPGDTIVMRYQ